MVKKQLALSALVLAAGSVAQAVTGTVSFQNGDTNGYSSEVNRLVSSSNPTGDVTSATTLGVDGYKSSNNSPDTVALIRFDNIFGSGANQIPAGAFILDARLILTSQSVQTTASTESAGPWGVSGLYTAWGAGTTYSTFASNASDTAGTGGNRGPWFENGTATRPLAGIGLSYGSASTQYPGLEQWNVNVTPIAQAWASGAYANNGVAVQAGFTGTDDGWIIRSGSHGTQAAHPKLQVTYTTDPVATTSLRQGVNGYTGTTMARVLYTPGSGGTVTDAAGIDTSVGIDYGSGATGNPSAVIKFDDIAAALPAGATLLKAEVVITTGTSTDARTAGTWSINKIVNDWDLNTPADGFGPDGVFSGTQLSTVTGAIAGAQALFDVTSDVAAILAGTAVNTGWSIQSTGSTDGWNIYWTGAGDESVRPELRLTYAVPTPEPAALSLLAMAPLAFRRQRR